LAWQGPHLRVLFLVVVARIIGAEDCVEQGTQIRGSRLHLPDHVLEDAQKTIMVRVELYEYIVPLRSYLLF